MARRSKQALLIDAMGTLVTLEAPAPRLIAVLARRFGLHVSEAAAARALAAEIGFYRAHMLEGCDAEGLAALRRGCGKVLLGSLVAGGFDGSSRLGGLSVDEITEALVESLVFRAFEDARPALVAARAAGRRIVVASNWDVSLADVLERVGLAPLLDGVVCSAAAGAAKPAPAVFEQALAVAGVPAGAAVHVGDSLAEDVEGARACGIRAVLLVRGGGGGGVSVPGVRVPGVSVPGVGGPGDGGARVCTIAALTELAWP